MTKREEWDELYVTESEGLDVLATADEAVEWTNKLIARIDASEK